MELQGTEFVIAKQIMILNLIVLVSMIEDEKHLYDHIICDILIPGQTISLETTYPG